MIKVRGSGIPIRLLTKYFRGKKICAVCDSRVVMWVPHTLIFRQPALMKHLQVIGSDVKNYACPVCDSHDRERHLALFFKKTGFLSQHVTGAEVLHFAPEKHISALIAASSPKKYVKCDLHPSAPDMERIDMQAISYGPQSFDVVVANHVLEHVLDDHLALSELHRILKVGGVAVLQTPFSGKLTTSLCDAGIDTDFLRTELCGQADHLRLYAKDIFDRISGHGFVARTASHRDILPEFDPDTYGVNRNEPFMLFQRVS
jgi:SAM-dependent methyltransferase